MNAVEAVPTRDLEPAPRLAGWPMLGSFSIVLVGLLALVFPTGSEYAAFTSESKPDAYSIAYLDVLTRANPKELDLRLVYGRQLAVLDRHDEALAVLGPVLLDSALGAKAKDLALDVSLARARAIPESDPRRTVAFADVHAQLRALRAFPRTPTRGEELATLALSLDDPALGASFYDDLAANDPAHRARHLASAGRWLRAANDNRAATSRYRFAHDAAESKAEAVEYASEAILSLEASDAPADAADLAATYAAEYPNDPRILGAATRLATACSRPVIARDIGRRLLALTPEDEAVMRGQAERELAAGDVKASLRLLNTLLGRHPNDYPLRLLRARVAEWAGDLDTAERDLVWLVAHRREGAP